MQKRILHLKSVNKRTLGATPPLPEGEGPNDVGLSRKHVISGCKSSLRRLGMDHIDLYQVHY